VREDDLKADSVLAPAFPSLSYINPTGYRGSESKWKIDVYDL
jgi:hypothetical protein